MRVLQARLRICLAIRAAGRRLRRPRLVQAERELTQVGTVAPYPRRRVGGGASAQGRSNSRLRLASVGCTLWQRDSLTRRQHRGGLSRLSTACDVCGACTSLLGAGQGSSTRRGLSLCAIKCSYSGYVRLGIRAWACACGAGSWGFHRKVVILHNERKTRNSHGTRQ